MRKLGIYGGTFSPLHIGHAEAARVFYDRLALDELLIMPAFLPPHKALTAAETAADRLAMAKLAFADDKRNITVSDYEIVRGGRSYTYLTLEHFASPDTDLYFLCGTDMFLTLDSWREPRRLFSLATMVHIRRQDVDPATERAIAAAADRYRETFAARLMDLPCDPKIVSSTEVRRRCRNGEPIDALVPKAVAAYIEERQLYREGHTE